MKKWLALSSNEIIRREAAKRFDDIEAQLDAMAADPDIQREIRQIQTEFAATESNRLPDTE